MVAGGRLDQSDICTYFSVSHSTPFLAGAGPIQLPLFACCQSSSAKALPLVWQNLFARHF